MKFSKKSRYGLRALVDLSMRSSPDPVALSGIAERSAISLQYLEQIFAALRVAGIVRSIKGPQGGYLLNRAEESITVASVLEALDGGYHIEAEVSSAGGIASVIQTDLIDPVNECLDALLLNLTLADLKESYMAMSEAEQNMYYI